MSSARTVMPMMPWPADGTIASGSSGRWAVSTSSRRSPATASRLAAQSPRIDLVDPGLHVAAHQRDPQVRPRMQQLRLPPQRGGADDGVRRAARRTPRPGLRRRSRGRGSARPARPRAAACRPARCLAAAPFPGPSGCAPRNRCGGPAALRGSPCRTGPCRRSRPARGPAPVARGADDVFLEHVLVVEARRQHRAEPRQQAQEHAGLHARERGAAGADA